MTYQVKESTLTLQGEGLRAGRVAVLCRFAGCNLWSGRERDRASAACRFCDTDFVGTDGMCGGRFEDAPTLARHLRSLWGARPGQPLLVFTGGEPLLQLDDVLVETCRDLGFEVAVETNGTLPAPPVDWLTVSPKAGAELVQRVGDELKLVHPQPGLDPRDLVELDFTWHLLQPMDGPDLLANLRSCVDYCLADPRWRMSIQAHKLLGLP